MRREALKLVVKNLRSPHLRLASRTKGVSMSKEDRREELSVLELVDSFNALVLGIFFWELNDLIESILAGSRVGIAHVSCSNFCCREVSNNRRFI